MIHKIGMRIFRRAQHQLIAFEHINKTGIALDQSTGKVHNAIQHRVQRIGCRHAAANFVQKIDTGECAAFRL